MSKRERRRLERMKKPCDAEGKRLPTGEAQPHDEHDVQQGPAVREETLLAGASKQRNAKISLGMYLSCPTYCVMQLTVFSRDI
jgi:hypothetical protein